MAPSNGAAKGRENEGTNGGNPTNGNPKQAPRRTAIQPAIPLPYLQRQKMSTASQRMTMPSPTTTNGAGPVKDTQAQIAASASGVSPSDAQLLGTNGARATEKETTPTTASAVPDGELKLPNDIPTPPASIPRPVETSVEQNQNSRSDSSLHHNNYSNNAPLASLNHRPSPRRRPQPFMSFGDHENSANHVSRNRPVHEHHPSNSSVHFGASESNNTSPAPPSGGIMPTMDGFHTSFGGIHPNRPGGYPVEATGYDGEIPNTTVDGFGRPMAAFAPPEMHVAFGPSTPHSFHDSHSSAHPDDGVAYGASNHINGGPVDVPGYRAINNVNGGLDDGRVTGPPGRYSRQIMQPPMHPPMPPPQMVQHMEGPDDRDLGAILAGLSSQFNDAEYADCVLRVMGPGQAWKLELFGHRVVFALSSALRNLKAVYPAEITGGYSDGGRELPLITLQIDDRYITQNGFATALQRLYGDRLFQIPPPPPGSRGVSPPGNLRAKFDFVLGYAASGRLLGLETVTARGMYMAADLLDWTVIEQALEFALGEVPTRASLESPSLFTSGYGQPTLILLHRVVDFIINNFPPSFSLDKSVADPETWARLPSVPAEPAAKKTSPTVVRGTRPDSGNRRSLSHIKFGDLTISNGDVAESKRSAGPSQVILSRVLLNLPFVFAKRALESVGPGGVNGWASAAARHKVLREVVLEREFRRQRVLDALHADRVPQSQDIKKALSAVEPRSLDEWDVLGWHETTVPYNNRDIPCMERRWMPLRPRNEGDASPAAAYP